MPVRIPFFDVLSDCLRAYDARRAPEQGGTQSGQPTRIGRKPSFLGGDTKASIAIWIAVMVPGLIMAAALGLEIGAWETAQISTQRSADLAAIAGAANYQTTHNDLRGSHGTIERRHWHGLTDLERFVHDTVQQPVHQYSHRQPDYREGDHLRGLGELLGPHAEGHGEQDSASDAIGVV
jgi:hypothetical protein